MIYKIVYQENGEICNSPHFNSYCSCYYQAIKYLYMEIKD